VPVFYIALSTVSLHNCAFCCVVLRHVNRRYLVLVFTDILEEWPYSLQHVNITNTVVITNFCVRSFLLVVAPSVVQYSKTCAEICTVSCGWNKVCSKCQLVVMCMIQGT
jgi:hypothetical protein